MLETLEWIEGTALAGIARDSLYGFQILVAIHILGLIFSVGTLLWVDLRMLGIVLRGQSLSLIYRSLARWFIVGFSAMFLSGAALFAGFATSAYGNVYFRVKIVAMLLAAINAIVFHTVLGRMPASADEGIPSGSVRMAGALSIVLWATVLVCGRMMSYTLF
jgi:hypothetical protein